jgi:hypothetical protein
MLSSICASLRCILAWVKFRSRVFATGRACTAAPVQFVRASMEAVLKVLL